MQHPLQSDSHRHKAGYKVFTLIVDGGASGTPPPSGAIALETRLRASEDASTGQKWSIRLHLGCDDFSFDVQIGAQIGAQIALARKWQIYEMGIHYFGFAYEEGKKNNWKDGIKALEYVF